MRMKRVIQRSRKGRRGSAESPCADREWTMPPDVFAQEATKAVRALSTIVVRPDFRTMFSNRARHSVTIIPDRAAPYGIRAYRSLQWMKARPDNRQVDVQGRDAHRFRVRSCPRDVTNMQEAEALLRSAVRSNWRVLRSPPTPVRHRRRKDQSKTVGITQSTPSMIGTSDEDDETSSKGLHSPGRVTLVSIVTEMEDTESNVGLPVTRGLARRTGLSLSGKRIDKSESKFRMKGLSPSEETLIMLNRHERHIVREAWEATLPEVDTHLADYERRAALAVEFEKDKWNLRSKEIEAINRARFLNEERKRNRKAKLLDSFHSFWLTEREDANAKQLKPRLQLLDRNYHRAMRKLRVEGEYGVEKRGPKKDPVRFLVDPSSEEFAPQMRFGDQARRWHEYLPNRGNIFENAEALKKLEECVEEHWERSKFELAAGNERESPELCVYLTKWTPAKLKMLHADLKERRKLSTRARCRFKPRQWAMQSESSEYENASNNSPRFVPPQEAKVLKAVLILQRILRGRAVQAIMYKGRRHNRELIREILSSKPFDTGEEEQDAATQGLNASTGWPRLKTYDEYSQRPLQEKWLQHVLSRLPPTLDVHNLMDFVNMNLMKMRGQRQDKSGENTETMPTPGPSSAKTSKTTLDGAYISCDVTRPGKKRPATPKRKPHSERRNFSEESEIARLMARVRLRQPRQGSQMASQPEETAEPPCASDPTSQEMIVERARNDVETIHEIPTTAPPDHTSTAANVSPCVAATTSITDSTNQEELTGYLSQRSTVEIHGRSSSHIGFRTVPWACRSSPIECPGTPASEDTVNAISRFTGDDFIDRRLDEEEILGPCPSTGLNVSASGSEDTPSTDDTHIITDDATELAAAAFRAKVREQGNTLAAQRIDEAPSPTDSANSSILAIPILGRSVSQQRAPADVAYSASEEQARRIIGQITNSETTITTETSESSWSLNEARQISISRHLRDRNRSRVLQVHVKQATARGKGSEKPQPVEFDEKDDLTK